jgi:uncharacterized protein YgiB involved in biofilm formation
MKRSRTLRLTAMALVPVALTACQPEMVDPPAQVAQFDYPSLQACLQADDIADGDCQRAFTAARSMAPRYSSEAECERIYGDDACEDYDRSGFLFIPLLRGYSVPYGYGTSKQSQYGSLAPVYGKNSVSSRRAVTVDPPPTRAVTQSRSGFGSSASARSGWGG